LLLLLYTSFTKFPLPNLPGWLSAQNFCKFLYLTIFDKSKSVECMLFGETVRKQRESKGLLLRQAAAFLEVDTAFVSKLERSERNASKEQVVKLANFLKIPEKELLTIWLADKILETIENTQQGEEALKLALKTIQS
jgi:transcriptional regulator with XRE-family HTH domain